MRPKVKADAPPMTDKVAVVLLGGWMAEPPGGASPGFGQGFMELAQLSDEGIVALWLMHETYLRRNAQRLGIEPVWDGGDERAVFFGEHLAYELAQRRQG